MKTTLCTLAGLLAFSTFAAEAEAAPRRKKPYQPSHSVKHGGDYIERLADKLPFGSTVWWEQMMRERRGGRPG